ncbi:MAG: DNA integrity scanning protein DisA nucleotide-binding domain protein, partial [Myxococcota bacterium]
VRAAGSLSQRRHGALIVLERDSNLGDLIEAGVSVDGQISKELLISIFQPSSPIHDGAVVVREGRVSSAGCILPLTLRLDLPEGVGTRHRAAVGITEETDALVVVVSEETARISVVLGGEMLRGLDAPRLRVVLREILSGERKELPEASEISGRLEVADGYEAGQATAS